MLIDGLDIHNKFYVDVCLSDVPDSHIKREDTENYLLRRLGKDIVDKFRKTDFIKIKWEDGLHDKRCSIEFNLIEKLMFKIAQLKHRKDIRVINGVPTFIQKPVFENLSEAIKFELDGIHQKLDAILNNTTNTKME